MRSPDHLQNESGQVQQAQGHSIPVPRFPRKGTRADEVLQAVIIAPVNQYDYRKGWRLAASIQKLEDLGWRFKTREVIKPDCRSTIKEYRLDHEHEPNLIALKSRGLV